MSEVSRSYEEGLQHALQQNLQPWYRLGNEIARGGQGIVYNATQELTRRPDPRVAVKILNAPGDDAMRIGFGEEARKLQVLKHENIIDIHKVGSVDNYYHGADGRATTDYGVPYFIMDYADGGSLQTRITEKSMDAFSTILFLREAMRGVAYAHKDGSTDKEGRIVHRDLKPANLLVAKDIVKVADFGIADFSKTHMDGTPTVRQSFQGTPMYMAPEQFDPNAPVQRATDIYAMGIVAYEALTHGAMPFKVHRHDSAQAWIAAHLTQTPLPLPVEGRSEYDILYLDDMQEVIARALQKKPEDRYESMTEFQEAARRASPPLRRRPRPRRIIPPAQGWPRTKLYIHGEDASAGFDPPPTDRPETAAPASPQTPPYPPTRKDAPPFLPARGKSDKGGNEAPSRPRIGRRLFLTALAAGVGAGAVFGMPKILESFEPEPPIDSANAEQAAVDNMAKRIMELLIDDGKKDSTLPILRELTQFNPDWVIAQASEELGIMDKDDSPQLRRRIFLENPYGALAVRQHFIDTNYSWSAAQDTAILAAGYTPLNRLGDEASEARRTNVHQGFNTPERKKLFSVVVDDQDAADTDYSNWHRLVACAKNPASVAYPPNAILEKFLNEDDLSAAETLGAALSGKVPSIAALALERLLPYSLQRPEPMFRSFITGLSDAIAQYNAPVVSGRLSGILSTKLTTEIITMTNRMAVSVAPFTPDAAATYITATARDETHLVAMALGRTLPGFVKELRKKTAPENRIWFDVALNPKNTDLTEQAIEALEDNPDMLRRDGATIASGLVAGRRFMG